MMFKFTPRLFDIISEMIRGTHEQIRTSEREVMRYAVRRGRMDRTNSVPLSQVKNQTLLG
jgi:RNA polymerase primary sigma factor